MAPGSLRPGPADLRPDDLRITAAVRVPGSSCRDAAVMQAPGCVVLAGWVRPISRPRRASIFAARTKLSAASGSGAAGSRTQTWVIGSPRATLSPSCSPAGGRPATSPRRSGTGSSWRFPASANCHARCWRCKSPSGSSSPSTTGRSRSRGPAPPAARALRLRPRIRAHSPRLRVHGPGLARRDDPPPRSPRRRDRLRIPASQPGVTGPHRSPALTCRRSENDRYKRCLA
jgi:hypothetical protein